MLHGLQKGKKWNYIMFFTYFSGVTVSLSRFLQSPSIDVKQATDVIKDTVTILKEKRCNAEVVFSQLFMEAQELAKQLEVELKPPRLVKKQIHRANQPTKVPEEYFRRAVYIPLLDHVLADIENRFSPEVLKLFHLGVFLPRTSYTDEDLTAVREAANVYELLLDAPISSIISEFKLWVAKWKREEENGVKFPQSVPEVIDLCDVLLYPSINIFLKILATLPVSVATAERSFSTLRRLKNWLRASMADERLTGLALLHIHRDINLDVDKIITRFAKSKRRKLNFVI